MPGGCTAPAAENRGKPGCFLSAEIAIDAAPAQLFWHVAEFRDEAAAQAEARKHKWSAVVRAHGRVWLHIVDGLKRSIAGGMSNAVIGPLAAPAGKRVTVRLLESLFPPGMKTRVHAHPGAEAFYVIEASSASRRRAIDI